MRCIFEVDVFDAGRHGNDNGLNTLLKKYVNEASVCVCSVRHTPGMNYWLNFIMYNCEICVEISVWNNNILSFDTSSGNMKIYFRYYNHEVHEMRYMMMTMIAREWMTEWGDERRTKCELALYVYLNRFFN
jgi:hypothetical protein